MGEESRNSGKPIEKLPQDYDIKIGDIIKIANTDILNPQIELRPSTDFTGQGLFFTVRDNDRVHIIEGPQTILDEDGNEMEIWKVVKNIFSAPQPNQPQTQELGWISREWFGELIKTQGN